MQCTLARNSTKHSRGLLIWPAQPCVTIVKYIQKWNRRKLAKHLRYVRLSVTRRRALSGSVRSSPSFGCGNGRKMPGKLRRGRPRNTWRRDVEAEMTPRNDKYNEHVRIQWRSSLIAYAPSEQTGLKVSK